MASELSGKKIAFLVANEGVEEVELTKPWEAVDLVRGRRITSWPSLQTDISNAGGEWVDEELVVDQGLVSSRKPEDLPAFCSKIVEEFAEGRHRVGAVS
jgi:protease I